MRGWEKNEMNEESTLHAVVWSLILAMGISSVIIIIFVLILLGWQQ